MYFTCELDEQACETVLNAFVKRGEVFHIADHVKYHSQYWLSHGIHTYDDMYRRADQALYQAKSQAEIN